MMYHTTHTIEPTVDGKYAVIVEWMDENNESICSGSAVVSRDPEGYAPILEANVRNSNEHLFISDVQEQEGEMINEV